MTTHFADRIFNIAVTGTLVRLELATVQSPKSEGEQPRLVPSETLVMPLDGFVASMGMLESMVKTLVDQGVLTRAAEPAQPAADSAAKAAEAPAKKKS